MKQHYSDRDFPAGFGTFAGVFTPCTLTILGVIMFLRFGEVVGQAGILYAVVIVAVSKAITFLTTLSLSAISTNTRVEGGGAYYIISRSLGVEFGGAIGVVFYIAQAVSVAMYVIGFSEAFVAVAPAGMSPILVSTITNVAVFVCVYIGAGWTVKVQYGILAALVLALLSFYIGAGAAFRASTFHENLLPHYDEGDNFFTMFALFFPAVTGIMAGANMSGDLRDPARSIPRGTLAAVAVTGVVYFSQALLLGGARPHEQLSTNHQIVSEVARWPLLIVVGVFAATLSSALGSMMGAPRILQAFARDNVFKSLRFFAAGSGATGEPRRAVVATFVMSQTAICAADLNSIAPVITMAFMITYGLLNLATFYEAATKNPSYRPRFRWCHWSTSLLGALGCLVVMFLIDWVWASVSIVLMGVLHGAITRQEIEARWGDVHRGVLFERTRRNLLKLEEELHHPKNWRPIILALSGGGWDRPHLAVYGHWFTSGHGLLSLGQVIQGDIEGRVARRAGQERILNNFIQEQQLEAFPAVVVAPYLSDGVESLVQCQGLGALRPNTVLLGWSTDPERAPAFVAMLRTIAALGASLVVVRFEEEPDDPWEVPEGTLDVWWRGRKNGELMLLLAHLLTKNSGWRSHQIRLLRVIQNRAGEDEVLRHLVELIDSSRIRATPHVVIADDSRSAIRDWSRTAAVTFMGFEAPDEGDELPFCQRMDDWAAELPRVVYVDSIGDMSLES